MPNPVDDLEITIIPLDYFRRIMGVDPYHFWQMEHPDHRVKTCDLVYTHERWHTHNAARLDMLMALQEAETNLAEVIRFWPGPKYIYREKDTLTHPGILSSRNIRPLTVQTKYSKVVDVGIQTWTLLEDSVALAYDPTSDNVSISVATTATSEAEITVVYPGTHIRIRPIRVTIAAGTATIIIKKWLLADPENWETGDVIDATDTSLFLSEVDVYRVFMDYTEQIVLYWEPHGLACDCLSETCPICSGCTQLACAAKVDYNIGLVGYQLATYSNGAYIRTDPTQHRYPDSAYISYLSGASPEGDYYMSRFWQRVVSHYGVALMDQALCDCQDVKDNFNYWQVDLSMQGGQYSYSYSQSAAESPIGNLRRGAVDAWNAIRRMVEL